MSYESEGEKEINELKSKIKYLEKTNRCIAKESVNGKPDLVWVMRNELKALSAISAVGGLTKYKLALLNSLKDKFINSNQSCEFELENMIYSLENDDG